MSHPLTQSSKSTFQFRSQSYDFSVRTYVMGILNVTPDSFSDGGMYFDSNRAIERGRQLANEGADFIDIGGESSRPGSEPISEEEELRRVLPVIQTLAKEISIPLSIDTYKSGVAEKAFTAGAQIVNDITGMIFDEKMMDVIRSHNACAIIMHMKGTPKTMQQEPTYDDVTEEIAGFLEEQAEKARERGIAKIIVDPGIGFGKTLVHNLEVLKNFRRFAELGYPVLVGPSRKSFIGKLLNASVEDRKEGTAAAVTAAILRGANIIRVHDVKEMKRVALVADALKNDTLSL
jgi:dihydropteroate synthase